MVGLYPNIAHDDDLTALKKTLDRRTDKSISTETLLELAECVLKTISLNTMSVFFKQLQGTAIGTKFSPPYAILFMSEQEENFLENS